MADPGPLTSLAVGKSATISGINLPPAQKARLQEMGLLIGTKIQVMRYAPLGDPIELKVRGYNLTLRKHEAELITIQPCD